MKYVIRKVNYDELDAAFSLIYNTFLEFIAPDYSSEGVETFKSHFIDNDNFKSLFKTGIQTMYGTYIKNKIVGILSISIHNNISCVFVDKAYHRKGIATNLFHYILSIAKERGVKRISLNAAPYAIPFYHAIGFVATNQKQNFQGMIYTPMELEL